MNTGRHLKTWERAKEEIENAIFLRNKYGGDEEMCVQSGLMLKHTISHYPSPISEVAFHEDKKNGIEIYVINYVASNSGESCIVEWTYDPKEGHAHMISKAAIRNHLRHCTWITSQQALIGYCDDMTLRAYSSNGFEEKYRIPMEDTVLDMLYIEEYDELITTGKGFVLSWRLKLIEIGLPLELKKPPLVCNVCGTLEWVHSITFYKATKTLLALTDDKLYIISMVSRQQIEVITNTHSTSLTGCAYYHPFSFFITSARDGSIHVYHTESQTVIQRFAGHRDGITGVATLTQQPIIISWSKSSGSLKMWRLDTMEIISETTLSEPILALQVVRNDRLFYRSDSDLRIFEMNALFSVFCTLTGNVDSLSVCQIRRCLHSIDDDEEESESELMTSVKFALTSGSQFSVAENTESDLTISSESKSQTIIVDDPALESALQQDISQEKSNKNSQGDVINNNKTLTDTELVVENKNQLEKRDSHLKEGKNQLFDKKDPSKIKLDKPDQIDTDGGTEENNENHNLDESANNLEISTLTLNNENSTLDVSEVISEDEMPIFTDNTIIDHRVICILDDHSIMTVSPLSGSILNIIFPTTELDQKCLAIDVDGKGKSCYIVLADSTVIEYDCTVNPGRIEQYIQPGKRQKVLSVVAMEVTWTENRMEKRQHAIFVGLDNGQIKLCNGAAGQPKYRPTCRNARRRITLLRDGIVPLLTMETLKAHSGQVNFMYAPSCGSLTCDNETINNILLTSGTDWRINIWRAETFQTSKPLHREVLLQKLKFFHWNEMPTCVALTDNVVLLGYASGQIEMHEFFWKSSSNMEVSNNGDKTVLSCVKKIPLGIELQHRKKVRCANESHQLKLFVTSSLDTVIKVWDTEGLLIREILLGCEDPLVCFSSGRDLLATFRNHIVRIASQDYLPDYYLYQLLDMREKKEEVEIEPEMPIPMESSEVETQKEVEDPVYVPFQAVKIKKFGFKQRAAMLCSLLRKPKKKEIEIKKEEEPEEEIPEEKFVMVDKSEVVKHIDLSAEFVSTLDRARIEKCAVAPDGIIPNSVIRDLVKSIYPNPPTELLDYYALQQYLLGYTDDFDEQYNQNQWEEMKVMLYESSSEDEVLSEESEADSKTGRKWRRLKGVREFELKKYLKGRREEGQMVQKIVLKTPTRIRKGKEKPVAVAEFIKKERQRRASLMQGLPMTDLLTVLLEEVSKQPWCPIKITVINLSEGLFAIADVLGSCSSKIAYHICKFVGAVFDACQKSSFNTETDRLFPDRVQKCLMNQMKNLFSLPSEHAQRAAANTLIKFNPEILKNFVMSCLMPGFLKRDFETDQIIFQTDEKAIKVAAQKLSVFTNIVDLDVLFEMGRLIGIQKVREKNDNERDCVQVISKALEDVGSDPIVNGAWARFILPILPENQFPPEEETPEETLSLISVKIVDVQDADTAPTLPTKKSSTFPSNFIHQNIERVASSRILLMEELAKASAASLVNSTRQISLINLPSKDQIFGNEQDKNIQSSSTGVSNIPYIGPHTSMDTEFAKTDIENQKSSETTKASQRNLIVDNYKSVDIQHLSLSNPIHPVSMTDALKGVRSKSNQRMDVREKPENLRRESIGVLKVMRRTSSTKSTQDLKSKIFESQRDLNRSQPYLQGSQQHFGTSHSDCVMKKSQEPLVKISEESLVKEESLSKISELPESASDLKVIDIVKPEDLSQKESIPIQPSDSTQSSSLKNSSSSKESSMAKRIVRLGNMASKNQSSSSSHFSESKKAASEVKSQELLSEIDLIKSEEIESIKLQSSSTQSQSSKSQGKQSTVHEISDITSDKEVVNVVKSSESNIEELPSVIKKSKSEEPILNDKEYMFRDPVHYFASRVFLQIDLPEPQQNKKKAKAKEKKVLPSIKSESDISKKSVASSRQKTDRSIRGIQESMGSSAFITSTVSNNITAAPSDDIESSVEQDEKWRNILQDLRESRAQETAKTKIPSPVKIKKTRTAIIPEPEILVVSSTDCLEQINLGLDRPVTPALGKEKVKKLPSLTPKTLKLPHRREISSVSPVKTKLRPKRYSADSSPIKKQPNLRHQFARCLERSQRRSHKNFDFERSKLPKSTPYTKYEWEIKSMAVTRTTDDKLPTIIG